MSNFSAIFRLKASDDGFSSAINKAKSKLGELGGAIGGGLKEQVGKIFSVKQAFTMLKGTMEEALNRAKQYNNLAAQMGIPAVEVAKLDKAAERAGINVSALSKSMSLVQKFAGEAIGGAAEKTKVLNTQLGATPDQMNKLMGGGTEALATASDLLMNVKDSGMRATLGMKLFGEKWTEIKPLIEKGGDAIRNMGSDQNTWGDTTQKSLTRTQLAWANMWNEISVLSAQVLEFIEPIIGILRYIGNEILIIVRVALAALNNGLDAIKFTIVGIKWALLQLLDALPFVDMSEEIRKTEKDLNRLADGINKRTGETVDAVKKDIDGMVAAANQVYGLENKVSEGINYAKKPVDEKSKETRTAEEIEQYEEQLKKQRELDIARKLSNATDEKKVDILREQLDLLREQEEELKKKHPEKYKETKEYLELQNKIADQNDKIKKQEISDAKKLYDAEVAFSDLSNERRIKDLENADADEMDIFNEKMRQQMEKTVRLAAELKALGTSGSDDDRRKKAMELVKAAGEGKDMIAKQKKKDAGGAEISNSLQSIGGGGAVAYVSYQQQALDEAQKTNENLEKLIQIAENAGVGSVLGGTYAPPKP